MQAFIPAAGLGTRLAPFTNDRPKALVEVDGVPLLKIAIDKMVQLGASRVVVNVHHFASKIIEFVKNGDWDVDVLVSDETDDLMDTGGGLKKASSLFRPGESILVHNVDVLSRIDYKSLFSSHAEHDAMVTMAVSERVTSRYLLFDKSNQLVGWQNKESGDVKWTDVPVANCKAYAFSGISVVSYPALSLLPPATSPYPIIPAYLELAKTHRMNCFIHPAMDWLDVGTPHKLSQASLWIHSSHM